MIHIPPNSAMEGETTNEASGVEAEEKHKEPEEEVLVEDIDTISKSDSEATTRTDLDGTIPAPDTITQNFISESSETDSKVLQILNQTTQLQLTNREETIQIIDLENEVEDQTDVAECYFDNLPDEIMHMILSHVRLGTLCSTVALVCKRWCDLACDPIHWQSLTVGRLSSSALTFCFSRAPRLKYLNLDSRDSLTLHETLLFSKSCPLIRELDLAFCLNLNNEQIAVIAGSCHHIEKLNMEGCRLVDDASLQIVSLMNKLTSLNVSHCTLVQTEGVEKLAINLPCLKELNIDGIPNVIDNAIFTIVLHHGEHIENLELDGVGLTDASVQALSGCERLSRLHISFSDLLTDTALLCIKKMKSLRALRLRKGSYFTREALVDLFTTGSLNHLTSLSLSECPQLHDDGVQALVKCCGKTLQRLELEWCWFITDAGLEIIVNNCPKMQKLDLLGIDKIFGHCLQSIPQKMPDLCDLDLQQCNRIIDDLVLDLVRKSKNLVAYNYYGERIQYDEDGVLIIQ